MKKALVLGGTGAMGVYLVPELAGMGYEVHSVSIDDVASDNPNIKQIKANAKDVDFLTQQLQGKYDVIVDFMIYTLAEFQSRLDLLLGNTAHYFFLSSYRVYADKEIPTLETSPRLLDVAENAEYLAHRDTEYSLYKAVKEDYLRLSGYRNYTILRPAITFSKRRFQLVTLEADTVVYRARHHLPVLLPKDALDKQATLNWAGDVAKMIARLALNPVALGEAYTIATAEHHTWAEVAEYYKQIIGLETIPIDTDDYLRLWPEQGREYARYQLLYDRCVHRVMDNGKLLSATGLRQKDLMPVKDALVLELSRLPQGDPFAESRVSKAMTERLLQSRRHSDK